MNSWKFFAFAGAMTAAAPVTSSPPVLTPPSVQTTWHCIASSSDNTISASIEVDDQGKGDHGEVEWNANVGDTFPIRATVFGYFSKDTPDNLHGHMLFLHPDLSDQHAHNALQGHKFHWVISTHSESDGQYPNWHTGAFAFTGKTTKFDAQGDGDPAILQFDPDDFFALARGSDQLFLLALDKSGNILLRRKFSLVALRAWPTSVQEFSRIAASLTQNYLKSCTRDDHDDNEIIV